jgi:Mg-chelatase subunit ChlD
MTTFQSASSRRLELPPSGGRESTLFNKIFSDDFIEKFSLEGFKSSNFGCIEKTDKSSSEFWAKRKESSFELVKLALSDPKQVEKVLMGQSNLINSEEDIKAEDFLEFAENIFSVSRKGKEVTSVFNVAAFKQMLVSQMKCNLSDHSPIIAKIISGDGKNLYTINLSHLKGFVGKQISEIVLNPEKNDEDGGMSLRPVMLPSIKSSKTQEKSPNKIWVKILLDISGSMSRYLDEYKIKVKGIISEIVKSTDDWQIDLTTFEDTSTTYAFDSKKHNLKSLNKFLDDLDTGNCTRLFATMVDELECVSKNDKDYTYTAFIVFTDGLDNIGGKNGYDVSDSSLKVRDKMNNLQMFSMELGNSNKEFFEYVANKSGFTHIQLSNIKDLEKFNQYTKGLLKDSIVLKMMDDSLKTWAQQVAVNGEITVSNVTVEKGTIFDFGGTKYIISNPTEDFVEPIGETVEYVNIQ